MITSDVTFPFEPYTGKGIQYNLSRYREFARPNKPHNFNNWSLAFDIERSIRWSNDGVVLDSRYSMMAVGYYGLRGLKRARQRQSARLYADFVERAATLNDFTERPQDPDYSMRNAGFDNEAANLQACFSPGSNSDRRVTIAVIPLRSTAELETVVSDIVPQAAAVFNRLNPLKPVDQDMISHSIVIAHRADAIMNAASRAQ